MRVLLLLGLALFLLAPAAVAQKHHHDHHAISARDMERVAAHGFMIRQFSARIWEREGVVGDLLAHAGVLFGLSGLVLEWGRRRRWLS